MPWKRPSDVPIGQVWRRFRGREMNGEPAKSYIVCDMEPHYKEEALKLMLETFLVDEPLCKILEIPSDPESIQTIVSNWEFLISQGISVVCCVEEDGKPGELVGFNVLCVKCIDDDEEDIDSVKGESWRKLLRTLMAAENLVDVFQLFSVNRYLTSSGLTVARHHRGQNIGKHIFAAREPLCKAMGLVAVATVFTATTSQVLAAKCDYQVLAVLNYGDMLKEGVDLTNCETKCAKLMGTKFNFS